MRPGGLWYSRSVMKLLVESLIAIRIPAVRSLRFVPLAFVAGIDGFAIFAPYLVFVLATLEVARGRRRRQAGRAKATGATTRPAVTPEPVFGLYPAT